MQISPDAVARVLADEQRRFAATHPTSARLAADAAQHLIGGVPMAWMTRLPGGYPVFFERAAGAHVVDVDGNDYVDFCLGDTGAMTGHAIDAVTSAVAARAAQGITTMLPSTDAAWVGEELARRFEIEFLMLFAKDARLYERNGFVRADNPLRWVKIDEHQTIGIAEQPLVELMIKPLSNRPWSAGLVDLLGYQF